ncbi:MAG: mercury transporter MerT [Zetaproteobacteria bacterium]|nr:mercury transporter MerT [Zetaproteobacteria bacterium]
MNPTPKHNKKSLIAALMTGTLASACCLGPLLVVSLGLGSASMFIALEPYRPMFAVLTLSLLAWVIWQHHQNKKACQNKGCEAKKPTMIWVMGAMSIVLLISPSLLPYMIK